MYDKKLVPRSSPVCGGGSLRKDEYNLGLHVMALFVVLLQSTFACAFPLIAKRCPRLRIPKYFLFFARHFGTGVLIATAFVHLLPTAFINLNDPCLPPFWNQDYPAIPGAIAMAAVFSVTIVEMVFTRGLCKGSYSEEDHRNATLESGMSVVRNSKVQQNGRMDDKEIGEVSTERGSTADSRAESWIGGGEDASVAASEHIGGSGGMGCVGFGLAGRRRSRSHSVAVGLQRFSSEMSARSPCRSPIQHHSPPTVAGDEITIVNDNPSSLTCATKKKDCSAIPCSDFITAEAPRRSANSVALNDMRDRLNALTPEQIHKKAMLQVILLEMGILFHSVFIGMALSVTTGSPFIVLLIAVTFHQTFEGLALGARIAVLKWKPVALKPWFMALAYGLTTPMGQAIGLGTHMLYSPESQTGLLLVGVMNAISSGLLVFAGLVELLAEDFLSDESWNTLRGRKRISACLCVFFGAFGMALVGAWA